YKIYEEEFIIKQIYNKAVIWMAIFTLGLFFVGNMEKASAEEVSNSFDYTCVASTSIAGDLEIDMKVTPTISVPETVESNETLTLEDIITDIEIDLTGSLDSLRTFINPFNGKINEFNMEVNGQPENIVGDAGVDIPETEHSDEDDFVSFAINGNDTEFTAGEEDFEIIAGDIEAEINAKLGVSPIDLTVACTPPEDNVITTVTVEEETEEDITEPVITLNGDNPMELEVGETYQEPGATAEDDVDGDISDNIEISGEDDTEEPGEYEITYTVVNEAGKEVTVTRTVSVNEGEEERGDGEDGNNGEDGEDGNDGADGEDGNDGADGEDGNDGADGEDGEDGNDGADGEDGNDGADGEDGNDGADGEDGNDGADGEDGNDGADGEDGNDGADGQDGNDGNNGQDGEAGKNSETRVDGTLGKTGVVGSSETDNDNDYAFTGSDNNSSDKPGTLPNTATNTPTLIAIGASLLLVGGTVLLIRKRKLMN